MREAILFIFMLILPAYVHSQTCHYFIHAVPEHGIKEEVSRKRIITNVFSAPCIDYGSRSGALMMHSSMERQFQNAIKIEYGKEAAIGTRNIWVSDFEAESEALKERREIMTDLLNDDYTIIHFKFEYYEE